MNAYTEIWEYKVLCKKVALLFWACNGRMQPWKEANNEFKAEGLKLITSVKWTNLARGVYVLWTHFYRPQNNLKYFQVTEIPSIV